MTAWKGRHYVRNSRSGDIIRPTGQIALASGPSHHGIMLARSKLVAGFVTEDVMAKKTVCPISRAEFRGNAKPTSVTIAGSPLIADVKEFSTGSLGWYLNGKI